MRRDNFQVSLSPPCCANDAMEHALLRIFPRRVEGGVQLYPSASSSISATRIDLWVRIAFGKTFSTSTCPGLIGSCIGGEMSPPRGSDHRTVNRHSIAWWIGRPDTPWQTSRRLLLGDLKPIDFILTILVTISQQSQCTGGMHTMLAYC